MSHKYVIVLSGQEYRNTKNHLIELQALNGEVSNSLLLIELAGTKRLERAKRCLERIDILLKK